MNVKVGDNVAYNKFHTKKDEIQVGDEKYFLFNENQLIGITRQ